MNKVEALAWLKEDEDRYLEFCNDDYDFSNFDEEAADIQEFSIDHINYLYAHGAKRVEIDVDSSNLYVKLDPKADAANLADIMKLVDYLEYKQEQVDGAVCWYFVDEFSKAVEAVIKEAYAVAIQTVIDAFNNEENKNEHNS